MSATVAVVGSGIAGLSAAYDLQKARHNVVVLDSAPTPGGRMSNQMLGPLKVSTGAHELFNFYREMRELIREVGIESHVIPMPGHYAFAVSRGDGEHAHSPTQSSLRLLLSSALGVRSKLRLASLWLDVRAARSSDPNLVHTAARFDDEDLAGYLTRRVGRDFLENIVEPYFRCLWGWEPEEISKAYFLSLAPRLGARFKLFNFADGIHELTTELARRLEVRCNTMVTAVVPGPRGRIVRYRDSSGEGELTADAVVLACYGDVVPKLVPDLRPHEAEFFAKVHYTSYGVVYYVLKPDAVVKPDRRIFARSHPSPFVIHGARLAEPAAGRPPVVTFALTPQKIAEFRESGASLEEFVRPLVSRHYPELDAVTAQCLSQWWERELPYFYPGYIRALADFLERQAGEPRSDLVFCGDYLAHATTGGACASGRRAARLLIDRLAS